MAEREKRINIIIQPNGMITASSEGMHGRECLSCMHLVFTALDAVPDIPIEQAASLLSADYYDQFPDSTQGHHHSRIKNYIFD